MAPPAVRPVYLNIPPTSREAHRAALRVPTAIPAWPNF